MNTKNLLSNVAKEMGKSDVAAAKLICNNIMKQWEIPM